MPTNSDAIPTSNDESCLPTLSFMLPTEAEVISELNAECPGFKCSPDKMLRCCCRRFLYNQPDFTNVKSRLETVCEERGFRVIFLPKFHCELSFIEMCWGFSKRVYRQFEPSSREDVLERNIIAALDSIPLETMRR